MRLKLKVCGLRDTDNIKSVSELEPDFMGFIYYLKSPRFVGNDFKMPSTAQASRVGVFVNESVDFILKKVSADSLNLVQLHGNESPTVVKQLSDNGVAVIKVFSIDMDFDFKSIEPYVVYSKYFLFDTKTVNYGGSGKTFNWNLLNSYTYSIPFFLSGGLSVENIQEVARIKHPALYGVDVNSGVEDSPAIKNIDGLKELIQILKTI